MAAHVTTATATTHPSWTMSTARCRLTQSSLMGSTLPFSCTMATNARTRPPPPRQHLIRRLCQFTWTRRGKVSFDFGSVSVSTPSSTRAVIASRSILFDNVNARE